MDLICKISWDLLFWRRKIPLNGLNLIKSTIKWSISPNFFILFSRHLSEIWFWSLGVLFLSQKSWYHMILQVRFTFWWSLKFKKLNSFIFSWNEVGRRNFNFVTWKIKKFRKLATGHSRNYLVTIGNLGYLKLVKSDMYPKFLEINLVVVVRHSAPVHIYKSHMGRAPRNSARYQRSLRKWRTGIGASSIVIMQKSKEC